MHLADIFPDPNVVAALGPEELGLHLLKVLPSRSIQIELASLLESVRNGYGTSYNSEVEQAVDEAWHWLVGQALLIPSRRFYGGGIMVFSRKALQLAKTPNPSRAFRARQLPKETLHERIREDVWGLYHRGKYDTAVFEAMKAVEVAVREAAGLPDSVVGISLMRTAFDIQSGALTDTQAEKGEREARAHLFAGAIGSFKNPHSHRSVELKDPDESAEIIMLANHLLRIVDSVGRVIEP